MRSFPLFTYGTLRFGEGNYDYFKSCVTSVRRNVTVPGRLYWVSGDGGYPVAKFTENGTITGDILYCNTDDPRFEQMVEMEIGAGYELKSVVCRDRARDIDAFGFHYIKSPQGQLIEGGDWVKAVSEKYGKRFYESTEELDEEWA